jgi:uncharacterized delta-60 repeat protein
MARKLTIIALVALSAAVSALPGRPAAASEPSQLSGLSQPAPVFPTAFSARPGDLDLSFDGDGKVITDFGADEEAHGVAVQSDGKIVAAGMTFDPVTYTGPGDFALSRYNANGSLDPAFGSGGKVRTDFGTLWDGASAVAIQADGKIVVAGSRNALDFALARYSPDGSLDSSFGGSGKVVTDLQSADWAHGVAIQPDGKIVAVGTQGGRFAVVRYNPNGSLDTSFGGVGYVITSITGGYDWAASILIQPDGKIVAAGYGNAGSPVENPGLALARYNPDGSTDASFGVAGKVYTRDPGASNVATQADGKLVVAGGIVSRYDANGRLDPSFGSHGKVALGRTASASVVLVQPDRKLVVAGRHAGDFLVARLKPNGSVDTTFGDHGQARTDIGSSDGVYAAALQSNRRIVVAGYTSTTSDPPDFALARYLNPASVTCRVPNVRGKRLAVASSALTKAHCRVGKVTRKASKKVKCNRIISQSPKAGAQLPNLGKVNLVVSRGRR